MLALLLAAACAPGYVEVPGPTCLAIPEQPARQVLVFLHGMYDPAHPQAEFAQETMLREKAVARGFAVLAPRGRAGLCDWAEKFSTWLCWPTKPSQLQAGGELLQSWAPAIAETMRKAQAPKAVALLGYSNGGFFATMIAGDSRQPLCALAILHAGLVPGAKLDTTRAVPTLLLLAEDDSVQAPRMRELQRALENAGWPSRLVTRAGGHGLTGVDLDAALDFLSCGR